MKDFLRPLCLAALLGASTALTPVWAQTNQQCVYETTADGPLTSANVRLVSGPGGCNIGSASNSDFYLYVIHDVTLTGNLYVGKTSGGTSAKLVVGRSAAGVLDAGSLTEPVGQNYGLILQGNSQSAVVLDVASGGLVSAYTLNIDKVDGIVESGGVVNIRCNAALTNNPDLTIDGRLNIAGNLDLTGITGSSKISGSGLSAGNGLRVQGNIYASNSNSVSSFFTTDGSGNPTLTVCVQGLSNTGCNAPSGTVASGTNNDPDCVSRVLPVTLTKFFSTWRQNGRVLTLNWQTASEKSNAAFVVERSVDGVEFAPLHRVPGAGTSTSPRSYAVTDEAPLDQLAYYRLKQVDYDGTTMTSSIIPVQPLTDGTASWLVATATPRQFRVQLPEAAGQLQVLDVMGRVVHRQSISADNSVVSLPATLSAGVYLYRLATPGGQFSQRLVLE